MGLLKSFGNAVKGAINVLKGTATKAGEITYSTTGNVDKAKEFEAASKVFTGIGFSQLRDANEGFVKPIASKVITAGIDFGVGAIKTSEPAPPTAVNVIANPTPPPPSSSSPPPVETVRGGQVNTDPDQVQYNSGGGLLSTLTQTNNDMGLLDTAGKIGAIASQLLNNVKPVTSTTVQKANEQVFVNSKTPQQIAEPILTAVQNAVFPTASTTQGGSSPTANTMPMWLKITLGVAGGFFVLIFGFLLLNKKR